jgi:hypothetical protein
LRGTIRNARRRLQALLKESSRPKSCALSLEATLARSEKAELNHRQAELIHIAGAVNHLLDLRKMHPICCCLLQGEHVYNTRGNRAEDCRQRDGGGACEEAARGCYWRSGSGVAAAAGAGSTAAAAGSTAAAAGSTAAEGGAAHAAAGRCGWVAPFLATYIYSCLSSKLAATMESSIPQLSAVLLHAPTTCHCAFSTLHYSLYYITVHYKTTPVWGAFMLQAFLFYPLPSALAVCPSCMYSSWLPPGFFSCSYSSSRSVMHVLARRPNMHGLPLCVEQPPKPMPRQSWLLTAPHAAPPGAW